MTSTYEKGAGARNAHPLPKVIKASRLDPSENSDFLLTRQALRVQARIVASDALARAMAFHAFAQDERWVRS